MTDTTTADATGDGAVARPSIKSLLLRLLGVLPPDGRLPLTKERLRDLYREPESFVDYLPWRGFADGVFEFADGASVGAVFELTPIDVEGRPSFILDKIESGIQKALQNIPAHGDSPWIVQTYLQDEPIGDLVDELREYATPAARETRHHQLWLDEIKEHIAHMEKPGGMFYDQGSQFWWNGQRRRVRCVIYRRSQRSEWLTKGGQPISGRGSPAQELNDVINCFIGSLTQAGVVARRYTAADLYRWLVPWFSPRPEGFDSPLEYLKTRPYPADDECIGAGADLAEMVVLGAPESRDDGSWCFTGVPHRLISLQAIDTPPITGVLTAEQDSPHGRTAAMWDQLPKGCVFVTTVVALPQSQVKLHCNKIIKAGGQGSPESRQSTAQAEKTLNNIAAGDYLMPTFSGLYVRGETDAELNRNTQQAINVLSSFQFSPIIPRYDPTASDNYVRHLPMAFDYELDKRLSRVTKLTYTRHVARMLPLYGRGTGTGNPGKLFYNRIGEPLTLDPLRDKARVAHGLIFGPTGAGKSATINYMILHEMAIFKPRIFIIEKGDSFGLLGKYLASTGLSVNHVKFKPGTDISLPPYANAFLALGQAEKNAASMELALTLTADDQFDKAGRLSDEEDDDEGRDYLSEMELITRMMITGADAEKEKNFELPDKQLVRRALLDATRRQRDKGEDYVIPSHVVTMFREYARDPDLSDSRKERIQYMADALEYWTDGLHGKFFNRPGRAWTESDVTILDMGILTSDQYKDMLAVAIVTMINTITGIGEKYQYEGRPTIVYTDEGHAITTNPTLVKPFVFGAKTWRKLNISLNQATQNLSDYPDEAEKMISLAEWWYCLVMSPDEVEQITRFRRLNDEQKVMLTSARKQKGAFTEGVVLSDNVNSLFRIVMPALPLALAGTDEDEKAVRRQLMNEHGITEIEAIYRVADEIKAARA